MKAEHPFFSEIYYSTQGGSTATITKKILSLDVDTGRSPAQIIGKAFDCHSILSKEAVISILPKYTGPAEAYETKYTISNFIHSLCQRDFASFKPHQVILHRDVFLRILKALAQHSLFDINDGSIKHHLQEAQQGLTKGAISAALIASQQGKQSTFVIADLKELVATWNNEFRLPKIAIPILESIRGGKKLTELTSKDLEEVNKFLVAMVAANKITPASLIVNVWHKNSFIRQAACRDILTQLGVMKKSAVDTAKIAAELEHKGEHKSSDRTAITVPSSAQLAPDTEWEEEGPDTVARLFRQFT